MIADEVDAAVATRQCETAAGIAFGLAVSQGTKDKGCVIGGSNFVGVSVRDVTLMLAPIDPLSDTEGTVDVYAQYKDMAVCSRGHIWVQAMANVKGGDPLYYDTTAGTFSNSSSGQMASGYVTFTKNPADGETLVLNGVTVTFKAGTATASSDQVLIGNLLSDTIANLVAFIASEAPDGTTTGLGALTAEAYPPTPVGGGSAAYQVNLAARTAGAITYGIVASGTAGTTVSAATTLGGTAAATIVNGGSWLTTAIAGDIAKISLGIQN